MQAQYAHSDTFNTIPHADAFQKCLLTGNLMMLISLFIMIAGTGVAYVMEAQLGLGTLITLHISVILAAASLKIGYILRAIALHSFGRKGF